LVTGAAAPSPAAQPLQPSFAQKHHACGQPAAVAPGTAPLQAMAPLFLCGICDDLMLDPTTLGCCGKSFCRGCLRQWIRTSVHTAGIPRCPAGCTAKLPIRLPARSHALRTAIEQLAPVRLEQRKKEAEEEEAALEEEVCHGGFRPWQEIVANRDIIFCTNLGVRQGTPGMVIGNFGDGFHLTVKFDEREDGSELCVVVLPEALMAPLPGGFRLGRRVVALYELMLNGVVGVRLGTGGVVVGRVSEDRLMVLFDARVDTGTGPGGPVSVSYREVGVQRPLVGGFSIAQEVQSAMDLVVGNQVVVRAGTRGSVLAEFSDTRLTVLFDSSEDGGQSCFNVLPMEVRPWCVPPGNLPVGSPVQAIRDLVSMNVMVKAGTRGVVLSGIDDTQVFVSFESREDGSGPQALTVDFSSVAKAEEYDRTALQLQELASMERAPRDAAADTGDALAKELRAPAVVE